MSAEKDYGRAIRSALLSRGITQIFVAQKMGLSNDNFHHRIKIKSVKVSFLVSVSDITGIPVQEILKLADEI